MSCQQSQLERSVLCETKQGGNSELQITITLCFMSRISGWFSTIFMPRKEKQVSLHTPNNIEYLIYL